MRCTRSPACVRVFLLARSSSGLGDRCRYSAPLMKNFDRIRDTADPRLSTFESEIVSSFSVANSRFYIDAKNRVRNVWVGREFSDANLKDLLRLQHLISFIAFDMHQPISTLTGESIQLLSQHHRICAVSLTNCTNITIESLNPIVDNKWIRWLHFAGDLITDEICQYFDRLNHVIFLNLDSSNLSDDSVDRFASLTSLRRLHLRNCGISSHGKARIQKLLPRCKIYPENAE